MDDYVRSIYATKKDGACRSGKVNDMMKKFVSLLLALLLVFSCCSALADNVLRPGDKGTQVRLAQKILKEYGYYSGSIDGLYGTGTTKAVKAFQKYNNLTVDGKIGAETAAVMNSGKAVHAPLNSEEDNNNTALVKTVQTLLKQYGYYTGKVDGVYGPATEAAVRSFQKYNKLDEDGLVGKKTLEKLQSGDVVRAPVVTSDANKTDVKHIQTRLAHYGYYTGKIDGVYGASTIAAVKAFQKGNDLTVDGAVGPKTLKKLNASNAIDKKTADENKAVSKCPTLRKGATGEYVRKAQKLLKAAGVYTGKTDGLYKGETINAVKAFQALNSLTVDGKIGPDTWRKLLKYDVAASTPSDKPLFDDGVMRPGDKGDDVLDLQKKLIKLGYAVTANGEYDTATKDAVMKFQALNGLTVDGKAGPKTMKVLNEQAK